MASPGPSGPAREELDPEAALRAYGRLEGWVRAWQVPEGREEGLEGCAACRVALYDRGRLVGAGQALTQAGEGPGALASAAQAAMAEAERVLLPARRDALFQEQAVAAAAGLTVSLELAGALTPLGEAELEDPDAALSPGADGLAVRRVDAWLFTFPMVLLASEASPSVEYPAMAARLLGAPSKGIELVRDLAADSGVAFYRFGVMHVAGVGVGGSAVFLHRCGTVTPASAVTTQGVRAFAIGLLDHFEATRLGGGLNLGLMGQVHPWRGVADPALATPTQQCLAAVALLRLAETPGIERVDRERATSLARSIMNDLQAVESGEVRTEDDGVAGAIAWVALWGLGAGRHEEDELRPFYDTCERLMREHVAADPTEAKGTVAEALLAWALAERAASTGQDRKFAEESLRAVLRGARPGALVSLLPWAGWAELALAPEGDVPAGTALRRVREQVWEHQLTGTDAGVQDGDLAGGIAFTEGGVSLPTWSSARPVAFLATMLGEPRLTTAGEVQGEAVHLVAAMRFLEQLTPGEAECRFFPDPGLARGGIRASVWDHRMPPEASAMALLTACEFLRSVEHVKPAPHAPPP
ncbi:MAG: hypothetical protein IPJ41_05250 [Phycisphaerales bacterium]|nr:hypothetical protein [Phycisphaerales bacterium]